MLFDDSDSDLEMLVEISDFDGDDTDDDDVELEQRSLSRTYTRTNYMQSLDNAAFTFIFRLNKTAVELLLPAIISRIRVTSKRNNGLAPLHQLLLTLRFYASGSMLISVADFIGVSKTSASRIVRDISRAIASLYNKFIVIHQNTAQNFYRMYQFPRVLGAIDCTHVAIQSPCHIIGEEYRNPNGYLSLNVQAVCDADLRLMNVVARWPGSAHDATIFNNSILRSQCDNGDFGNRWILGDSAYPIRPYLLTPLLNPVSESEQRYNAAHARTRNCIQRTFGVWKRRFPVIALTLRLSLDTIQSIIIATAVLHNICRLHHVVDVPPEVELPLDDTDVGEASQSCIHDLVHDGTAREELINNFFNNSSTL